MPVIELTSGDDVFVLEIGVEKHVRGGDLHLYATDGQYREMASAYEADKGSILLEAVPGVVSQWGDSSWSTSLTARDANVERIEKLDLAFEEASDEAIKVGDDQASAAIKFVQKQLRDYYFKYTSTNARFECHARCQSHQKKVLGVVVDTRTANLEIFFTLRTAKLVSPEEAALLETFIKTAATKGLSFKFNDEVPAAPAN